MHECSKHQIGSKIVMETLSAELLLQSGKLDAEYKAKKLNLPAMIPHLYHAIISLHLIRPEPLSKYN